MVTLGLRILANQVLMKNISDFGEGMSYQRSNKVVLLLLKTELILIEKMKVVLKHPDAGLTIMLKHLNIRIGELLNMIMADELACMDGNAEGPSSRAHFDQRITYIESHAAQLLEFAGSFYFDLAWCSECLHRLEHLATQYKDANCSS
jgi:hypothetical protein